MIEKVNIKLLEQHVEGYISADEVLFEDGSTLNSVQLIEALEEYNRLIIGIEAEGLRNDLKVIHREVVGRKHPLRLYITVAASLLLIMMSILVLKKKGEPTFEDYFSHFDQLLTFRGEENELLSKALSDYSQRDYKSAYLAFQRLNKEKLNPEASFYAGVSALASNYLNEALDYFTIASEGENNYYQQIRWYSALTYWQLGRIDFCLSLLSDIEEDQFKFKQAQRLLKHLKSSE